VKIHSLTLAIGLAAFPVAASAQVLDLGGGGAFTDAITANNTGRAAGWFYDNTSADRTASASQCNVGFFALGTIQAGCANQAAGTFANRGGYVGGTGWGDGDQPAPFMFSGQYGYNLRLGRFACRPAIASSASSASTTTVATSSRHSVLRFEAGQLDLLGRRRQRLGLLHPEHVQPEHRWLPRLALRLL
jgi:hypothetical protein